jgi:hypothetical protein
MFRIIFGAITTVIGILGLAGLTTNYSNQKIFPHPLQILITYVIIILAGLLLLYFGIIFINSRKKLINIILKIQRENNCIIIENVINASKSEELKIRETIKYILKKGWLKEPLEIK